jgi:hypothetical protein
MWQAIAARMPDAASVSHDAGGLALAADGDDGRTASTSAALHAHRVLWPAPPGLTPRVGLQLGQQLGRSHRGQPCPALIGLVAGAVGGGARRPAWMPHGAAAALAGTRRWPGSSAWPPHAARRG